MEIADENRTFNQSTFEATRPLRTLRSLHIQGFRFENEGSIAYFLKKFPVLDSLVMNTTHLPTNRSNTCLSNIPETLTYLVLYNISDSSVVRNGIFYSEAYISLLTRQGRHLKHLQL